MCQALWFRGVKAQKTLDEIEPSNADYHFSLATVYRRQYKDDEAIASYEAALERNSSPKVVADWLALEL